MGSRAAQVLQATQQKAGYAYDFSQKRVLEPLTLALALKQLKSVGDDLDSDLLKKKAALDKVQNQLHEEMQKTFAEAFENRDRHSLQ